MPAYVSMHVAPCVSSEAGAYGKYGPSGLGFEENDNIVLGVSPFLSGGTFSAAHLHAIHTRLGCCPCIGLQCIAMHSLYLAKEIIKELKAQIRHVTETFIRNHMNTFQHSGKWNYSQLCV